MDLLATNFKKGSAVEDVVDVFKVENFVRLCQVEVCCMGRIGGLKGSGDNWTGFISFVNGKLKFCIGLGIVFDFLQLALLRLRIVMRCMYICGCVLADTIQEISFTDFAKNVQDNLSGTFLVCACHFEYRRFLPN